MEQGEIKIGELEKLLKKLELERVKDDFTARLITIIIGALGLIAALAWDDFLRQGFASLLGEPLGLGGKLLFALIITLIGAGASVMINKILKRKKERVLEKLGD
jgi:hypothetical protein